MSARTIEEIFCRYRDTGDPRALARVFDRLAPDLLGLARYLAHPGTEAEDLLQATFLTAMESAESYDPGRPLAAWLNGILANHARKARRAQRPPAASRPGTKGSGDPRCQAELGELQESLQRSVEGLPEPYRPVLGLYLLHGLSPKEIATTLDRSRATVRSQIHRGLEILRRGLPAGLVGALVLATAGRGLAAVRRTVLRAVPKTASPWLLGTLGGLMSAKKITTVTILGIAGVIALMWVMQRPLSPVTVPSATPQTRQPMVAATPVTPPERQLLAADAGLPGPGTTGTEATALRVQVIRDTDDAPVPGRWITLLRPDAPDGIRYFPLRQARTNESGEVRFEDLEPDVYEIRALLVPGRPTVDVQPHRLTELEVRLPPGVLVHGRVVDTDGNGVSGADIYMDTGWTSHGRPVATADGQGRFSIADVPERFRLGAMADGFAPSPHHPIQPGKDGSEALEIVMNRAAATLRGIVLSPEGQPIPYAFVAIQPLDMGQTHRDGEGRSWRPAQVQVLRADGQGVYVCRQVPAEPVLVAAGATGHVEFVPAREAVDLAPGEERFLTLQTSRGATVEGRVTRSGLAVPAFELYAIAQPRQLEQNADWAISQFEHRGQFTDRRGHYRIAGLRPGRYLLSGEGMAASPEERTITLESGQSLERDLQLLPEAQLLLRLVDEAGQPLPGWQITVHYRSTWPSAISDDRGELRFTDFDEGRYRILVESPSDKAQTDHVFAALGLEGLATGDEFHTIRVAADQMPTARIRARILDAEGRVPAAARLNIDASVLRLPQWGSADADERGFVDTGTMPPGTYKLSVTSRDHERLSLGTRELGPNETLELGEIVLR